MQEQAQKALLTFSKVFNNDAGSDVLKHLERVTDARGIRYGIPRNPQRPFDPYEQAYMEGARSVYWYIVGMIEGSNGRS